MKPLTIIMRSLGVVCLAGFIMLPVKLTYSGGTVEAEAEIGAAEPTEIRIMDPVEPASPTIFETPHFAYLAEESALRPANFNNRPGNDTENRIAVAKNLAEQKQFARALIILANVQTSDQSLYDVRFLRARILSWDGQYYSAEQEFRALRRQYPQDADIMVAYGYLQYYQSRLINAENLFIQVLQKYPNYEDAQRGLTRVKQARKNQ